MYRNVACNLTPIQKKLPWMRVQELRTLLLKHAAYSLDIDAVRGRGSHSNAVRALLDF